MRQVIFAQPPDDFGNFMDVNDSIGILYWDPDYNPVMLINFSIAIALFASLRLFAGNVAHVNTSEELTKKDNTAFGISLAGVAFGITIIISGAVFGKPVNTLWDSAIAVALYGVIGLILLVLARFIFDKLAFTGFSIRDEIVKGNVAVGMIDAGNTVASAIIIRAVMVWVDTNTAEGLISILVAYFVSQVIMTGATLARLKLFARQNEDFSAQEALAQGNTALALRFAGRKIGTAFAIASASNVMVYEIYSFPTLVTAWAALSIVMVIILTGLSKVATMVILGGIDLKSEIIQQRNVALGTIQGVVYLSLGLLLAELTV
jgi:uncharacterized membrane protein YjfL (UPF0719 family)